MINLKKLILQERKKPVFPLQSASIKNKSNRYSRNDLDPTLAERLMSQQTILHGCQHRTVGEKKRCADILPRNSTLQETVKTVVGDGHTPTEQ